MQGMGAAPSKPPLVPKGVAFVSFVATRFVGSGITQCASYTSPSLHPSACS